MTTDPDLAWPELDPDYTEPDDGLHEFRLDDFDLDDDAANLPDLTDDIPDAPPELDGGQDAEAGEGFGAGIPTYVRTTLAAITLILQAIAHRTRVPVGRCLQITRGWWNVGPYYLAAKDSLAGAQRLGVAHRVEFSEAGVARIPRMVAVYFTGPHSQYGHIAPTLGGSFCGTTDWPAGFVGRVNILALAKAWGFTEIWWAPVVNDVRVWSPRRPKATPLLTRYLANVSDINLLRKLAENGDGSHPDEVKRAAAKMLEAYDMRERADRIEKRADHKLAMGRQALNNLEVTK